MDLKRILFIISISTIGILSVLWYLGGVANEERRMGIRNDSVNLFFEDVLHKDFLPEGNEFAFSKLNNIPNALLPAPQSITKWAYDDTNLFLSYGLEEVDSDTIELFDLVLTFPYEDVYLEDEGEGIMATLQRIFNEDIAIDDLICNKEEYAISCRGSWDLTDESEMFLTVHTPVKFSFTDLYNYYLDSPEEIYGNDLDLIVYVEMCLIPKEGRLISGTGKCQ